MTNEIANLLTGHKHPVWRLSIDGADLSAMLEERLISLTLTDNRGFEADQLDIVLNDADGKLDIPARGVEIRLAIGWSDSGLVEKGTYIVDDVEHSGAPDTLSLRARSAELNGGLATQRERSWHDTTVGDIVRTIAEECGLAAQISDALAVQKIDHLDQTAESGANLLTRLSKQFDAIATVKNGALLFIPAASGLSASGKPLPAITITRASGDRHRFAISDRDTCTAVRAYYQDTATALKGEVIWSATEEAAELQAPPPAVAPPPSGNYKMLGKIYKSRAAAIRAAKAEWKRIKANRTARTAYIGVVAKYNDPNVGVAGEVPYGQAEEAKKRSNARQLAERDANKINPDQAKAIDHSADAMKTLRHSYASKENAKRAARAEWRRMQRGLAELTISLCQGRPEIFPEQPASVQGFKPQIDSTAWIISEAVHRLSESGLITDLKLEIQATGTPPLFDLQGVQFDTDQAVLRPESYPILDKVAATLNEYAATQVEVAGHTDSIGADAYNQRLSLARATAVMNYLIAHVVAAERLRAMGYGETRPIASNATEAGRAKNRRVELRVI